MGPVDVLDLNPRPRIRLTEVSNVCVLTGYTDVTLFSSVFRQ